MTIKSMTFESPIPGSSSSAPSIIEGSTIQGTDAVLLIADMSVRDLLEGIYIELKILNLRQEEAFEETVNDGDIEL